MPEPIHFSQDDLHLLADLNFFRRKAILSKKIKRTLEVLYDQLKPEAYSHALLAPEELNLQSVQFVKGEHLEDSPYQYLDFPRHYTRETKFAFRSLIWWGHHAAFALLVEGPLVKHYRKNLFNRFSDVAGRQLCLSLSPSLWEWKTGAGLTLEITHERRSELAAVLDRRTAFKIVRFVPFDDSVAESGALIQEGIRTFQSVLPIITP